MYTATPQKGRVSLEQTDQYIFSIIGNALEAHKLISFANLAHITQRVTVHCTFYGSDFSIAESRTVVTINVSH